jgi:hypothetical protein
MLGTGGGLLAAGATAGAGWLVHVNRIGFRANLLPLLLALWVWLLLRALDEQGNRRRDWLGAGVVLGLIAYSYLAGRMVPVLLALFVGYLAIWQRPLLRCCWRGLVLMLAAATLVVMPLVVHFLRVPSDWSERYSQVALCGGVLDVACLGDIVQHAWAALLLVGVRGDPAVFLNTPDSPALPVLVGWLFYPGLLLALWRWKEPAMALLVLWWGTMVLPGVLSMESPHYLRMIGAAPPSMLVWALALVAAGTWLRRSWPRLQPALPAVGAALVLFIAASTAYDYFGQWARRPVLYYGYMAYATQAAQVAQQVPPDVNLYISEDYYRHASYIYLAPRTEQAHWFDGRAAWPLAPPGEPALYILSAMTPLDERVAPFVRDGQGESVVNERNQYAYLLLTMPQGMQTPPQPEIVGDAALGPLAFQGMSIQPHQPGKPLRLTLFWQVREPAIEPTVEPAIESNMREMRLFVHLLDESGVLLAQDDSLGYPAAEWQAGERFVTFHTLPLPAAGIPEGARLEVGLYDTHSGERLPASGPDAQQGRVWLPLHALDEQGNWLDN